MHKSCFYIFAFVLLLSAIGVNAQTADTITYNDSIPAVLPELVEEDDSTFDTITAADGVGVQVRTTDRAALKKMQEDDDFWYHNTAPPPKKIINKKQIQPYKPAKWLPYLLWSILIGGFIAFLIWFLMTSNVKLFKSSSKQIVNNVDDQAPEDIFEIDYNTKIDVAIQAKDYRLGIRLMYLQLLSNLSNQGIINYAQQKTNNDYVMQLYGTKYYNSFFQLTRHFEYTWYGKFPISEERFREMKSEFDELKRAIRL